MNETTIRLGGVPEHFNLPIHLAIEDGSFKKRGLNVVWHEFGGGTGQMTQALRNNEVDACILLTEGIIKDIVKGNPARIVSGYINTPLTWGIHSGAANSLNNHQDIYDKKYAISRFGSGSHLMAVVDAVSHERQINEDQFVVIKNLEGALSSLSQQETDVFYWEKFTTKPFVDSGQLKRVGEFVTPWPCFVIACTEDILKKEPDNIVRMLRTIHDVSDQFMQNEDAIPIVSYRYKQKLADVERWYHSTEWAIHGWVSDKMLRSVVFNLRAADIIGKDEVIPELVWRR